MIEIAKEENVNINVNYYLNSKVDFDTEGIDSLNYYDDSNSLDFGAYNEIISTSKDRVSLVINDTFFTKHMYTNELKEILRRCDYIYSENIDKSILIGPYRQCNYRFKATQNEFVATYLFAFNRAFANSYREAYLQDKSKYDQIISIYKYYLHGSIPRDKNLAKFNAVVYERIVSEVAFNNGVIWYLDFGLFERLKNMIVRRLTVNWK
ncbi:hypothetical protein [Vibrio nomapromontoriensis]|uniref:hypothetical protein n=1 Tax=Vibrio nomapromontoriensis TaxID=2910246 RepID=UPI003D121F43